jgi:hypothetical protein
MLTVSDYLYKGFHFAHSEKYLPLEGQAEIRVDVVNLLQKDENLQLFQRHYECHSVMPDQIERAENSGHLTAWLSACYRGLRSGDGRHWVKPRDDRPHLLVLQQLVNRARRVIG